MEVYCSNKAKGCGWKGAIEKLTDHLGKCEFKEGSLPKWLEDLMPAMQEEYEKQLAINEA